MIRDDSRHTIHFPLLSSSSFERIPVRRIPVIPPLDLTVAGFALLIRARASGLLSHSDKECNLLEAVCQAACIQPNGKTVYEDIKGRRYNKEILEFGEQEVVCRRRA